ncbi:hypothetical protein Tco_0711475 [Tanacetum coccineum]
MSHFKVLQTQFQMFIIKSAYYLDDEYFDMTTQQKFLNTLASNSRIPDTKPDPTHGISRIKRADTAADQDDAHVADADIRPIYNEELMAEVQTTAEINIFATGQQHTEQPKFNNEGKVDQNAEQCHDIRHFPAK